MESGTSPADGRRHKAHSEAMPALVTVITQICRICVVIFAMCVVFIATVYTVTYDYSRSEWFWRTSEIPFVVIGCLIVLAVLVCPNYDWLSKHVPVRLLPKVTFGVSMVLGLLWVMVSDPLQEWDQGDVLNAARVKTQFADIDLTQYGEGGYMERYPYQAPLVVLMRALILLSGSRADYVFCIMNAVAVAITMAAIVKLAMMIRHDEDSATPYIASLLSITFLPAYFYAVMVYGNTLSIMFIAMGFYAQAWYMNNPRGRRSYGMGVGSAVCIALAIVIKSSSVVALIAYVLIWLIWALWNRSIVPIAFIVAAYVLKVILVAAPTAYLERLADVDLSRGEPSITWIAMGIGASQPEDEPIVQPWPGGIHDGYPWRIPDAQYSPDAYASLSRDLIANRIDRFRDQPDQAIRFFVGKFAYEWADPLYESLVSSNWTVGDAVTVQDGPVAGSQADRPLTPFAYSAYYGKANFVIRWLCDVMQTMLYAGFLIGSIMMCRRRHAERWMLAGASALYAAGGAALYLIWEARSQYTLGFAMLMIPIASFGLAALAHRCRRAASSIRSLMMRKDSEHPPRHRGHQE